MDIETGPRPQNGFRLETRNDVTAAAWRGGGATSDRLEKNRKLTCGRDTSRETGTMQFAE